MRLTRRTGLVPPCKAFGSQAQDLIARASAGGGDGGLEVCPAGQEQQRLASRFQKKPAAQVFRKCFENYQGMGLLERVEGIEPSYSAWKAAALPLSYTRGGDFDPCRMVEGVGFEPT